MPLENMKIETTLTTKDYNVYYKFIFFSHFKLHWIIFIVWLPTLFTYWNRDYESTVDRIMVTLIATILYLLSILVVFVLLILAYKFFRRTEKQVLGKHVFEIVHDNFIEENEVTKTETKIPMLRKIVIEKNHIFLMQKNGLTHIIPRISFTNQENEKLFIEKIKSQMP